MVARVGTIAVLALAGAALVVAAAGCTPTGGGSALGATPSVGSVPTTSPDTTPTPPPSVPASLDPQASAAENLPYFDAVSLAVITANAEAGGRDFIDALTAAGFDRSEMQVTADRTTIDLASDSVQFAVLFQGECLIGQYGPASGGYHSAVRPALGTGGCLVGQTRPIDW